LLGWRFKVDFAKRLSPGFRLAPSLSAEQVTSGDDQPRPGIGGWDIGEPTPGDGHRLGRDAVGITGASTTRVGGYEVQVREDLGEPGLNSVEITLGMPRHDPYCRFQPTSLQRVRSLRSDRLTCDRLCGMTATPSTATTSTLGHDASADAAAVVRTFLLALEASELDAALALLADDVVYTNVSLPTIHGRARVERVFRPLLERLHGRFRVHFHTIATDGQTVLTERTDALGLGRFEQRFWVYGRFDVVDGRIAVWRDSFDWLDISVSLVRGVAGAFATRLNRRWPGNP